MAGGSWANARCDGMSLRRVELLEMRLTGVDLANAEIDLQHAALESVELVDCDLAGARLASATFANRALRRCRLAGLVNPERLAGARMTVSDALDAVETLAAAAGIELLPEADAG